MNCKVLIYGLFLSLTSSAFGQAQSIKIGELNSYKVFPAFLEPYRKGWQLALEEINRSGGVLGRQLEVVSRDDGGTPGDAVRVAEELISREQVTVLMGTFASNVGLAVANLAQQRKLVFMAAEPLTDKIVWENGNRYTFRLRPSTYMQVAMLVPEANTRGLFKSAAVVNLLGGEPEYLDPLKDETPEGWWVTGYPWSEINTPEHTKFRDAYQKRWKDYPRLGSVVGYSALYAVANGIRKAGSLDADKLIAAFEGLRMQTPFGEILWRPLDHQSTMGAYVGQLAKKGGQGVMVNWHYADGAKVQPSDQEVRALRKE